MKTRLFLLFFIAFSQIKAQNYDKTKEGFLVFHAIKTDKNGKIIPWYSEELGKAYSHTIQKVWSFWDTMRIDMNGLPYYMNHQVWRPNVNDARGLGGDQFAMALSSWQLLYQFTGNEKIKENMKFIADYYLTHSLSPDNALWATIPYPYNTKMYSGFYDGDMILGKYFTQPDKAGAFGLELIKLYKIVSRKDYPHASETEYLNAATAIANTLAKHTKDGDNDSSPLPFKVNALTGEVGKLKSNEGNGGDAGNSSYTTNWVGTLQLFQALIQLQKGNVDEYQKAFDKIVAWMKNYPLKTNKWGPFFEDIPGWSDTQINAITFARFMIENSTLFPNWKIEVNRIFDWVYQKLGNYSWQKYGVVVVNEQTAYQTPGNSHTSRQAATELLYVVRTEDAKRKENAILQLNWATYMVDNDGKNCYPRDEVWLTDGYGDYIRHYLQAMAVMPELAPSSENHILHSTSIIQKADYAPNLNKNLVPDVPYTDIDKIRVFYTTFDISATETLRLTTKPSKVLAGKKEIQELQNLDKEGFTWRALDKGGVLILRHDSSNRITIY